MPKSEKIRSIDEIAKIISSEKRKDKKVALCHGVFDVVHPGHVLHFQEAKKNADLLVVTVTPDHYVNKGPGRPYFNERLRREHLAALECVDYVGLNEWPTAVEAILKIKPNFYVKGSDYRDPKDDLTGKINDESRAIHRVGGKIIFTDGETYSSSSLINQFFQTYSPETETYLSAIRRKYSAADIVRQMQSVADVDVLVVGEAIVDLYCYCKPIGMSPKEGITVSQHQSEERFAGGALATANHLAGFCRRVTLVTAFEDGCAHYDFVRSKMRPNVKIIPVFTRGRPTIVKKRYIEPTFVKKMFEVQYLDDTPLESSTEKKVAMLVRREMRRHEMTVVADYGHGFLTDALRRTLNDSRRFLAVNAQTNSANMGFNLITKYSHSDFVCIDELELKLASGAQYGDFRQTAVRLFKRLKAKKIIITRGYRGLLLVSSPRELLEAPGLSTKVIDRVGAGDAVFAVLSPCAYRKFPDEILSLVGSCAGALAVGTMCNRDPIDSVLLFKFITRLLK